MITLILILLFVLVTAVMAIAFLPVLLVPALVGVDMLVCILIIKAFFVRRKTKKKEKK